MVNFELLELLYSRDYIWISWDVQGDPSKLNLLHHRNSNVMLFYIRTTLTHYLYGAYMLVIPMYLIQFALYSALY